MRKNVKKTDVVKYAREHDGDKNLLALIGKTVREGVCDGVTTDEALGKLILQPILATTEPSEVKGLERMLEAFTGWDTESLLNIVIDDLMHLKRGR